MKNYKTKIKTYTTKSDLSNLEKDINKDKSLDVKQKKSLLRDIAIKMSKGTETRSKDTLKEYKDRLKKCESTNDYKLLERDVLRDNVIEEDDKLKLLEDINGKTNDVIEDTEVEPVIREDNIDNVAESKQFKVLGKSIETSKFKTISKLLKSTESKFNNTNDEFTDFFENLSDEDYDMIVDKIGEAGNIISVNLENNKIHIVISKDGIDNTDAILNNIYKTLDELGINYFDNSWIKQTFIDNDLADDGAVGYRLSIGL